jgi:hypothetical protein
MLAEIEVDPVQLEAYRAALREEIQSSIRLESGVLKLYAVALKGEVGRFRYLRCIGIRRRMKVTYGRGTSGISECDCGNGQGAEAVGSGAGDCG